MSIRLTEDKTVGRLAAEHPALRPVLESYGIDYCCGGKLDLATAAHSAGLSLEQLETILNEAQSRIEAQAAGERDWLKAPLHELIDHIEGRHHAYMRSALPRTEGLIRDVMRAHGALYGAMLTKLNRVFAGLRYEIESHLDKEEQVLFPYIRAMEDCRRRGEAVPPMHCGTVQNPIRQMELEHDSAGEALAEMRELTSHYRLPDGACEKFDELYRALQEIEADLHEHIHLENNILFPRAIEMEAG